MKNRYKDHSYEIHIIDDVGGHDEINDNVDVEIRLDNGEKYIATFFTIENVISLLRKYKETNECASGTYLWSSDMIIIKRLTKENIENTISDLIANGEFEQALSGPFV